MEGLPTHEATPQRLPHAALDAPSRVRKARKIEAILQRYTELERAKVLDIGTGSGHIAATIAGAVGPGGEVWGIDQVDQRQRSAGFHFLRVSDAHLPFDDGSFDVVISNHVVEHVGDRSAQLEHLSEISRVLGQQGVAYLATPNRWAVIEPHYHLPFLSWLPASLRDGYLRLTGAQSHYDCNPLGPSELVALFRSAGLRSRDATIDAIRAMAEIERTNLPVRQIRRVPRWSFDVIHPVVPTLVYVLKKKM